MDLTGGATTGGATTDERVEVDVAAEAAVPPEGGGGLPVEAEGRPIALFRLGEEIVAYQGSCLHRGGPLALGDTRSGILTCPSHWWRYELTTGALVGDPSVRLRRYPVAVEGGRVRVTVPRPRPPESWRDRLLRAAREGRDDD